VDFSFPPQVERFRAELREWLAAHLTAEVVASAQRAPGDPHAFETVQGWNRALADAGWHAVAWPSEYGGCDASTLEQLVDAEETMRARAPIPINVIGMNNMAPAIMRYGTESQKRALLPRMARADDIWCQGMSEPDAGSDLASLRTRAVRDSACFVVTGQKTWTSLGHRAHWCQLYVRTDPEAPEHRARGGVTHALWAADAAPAAERRLAALRAKTFAGRLATVGDMAIQVFGGLGFTWEHDSHLYLKRLLSWSAFRGGPDGYLQDVGARLVEDLRSARS
jgi:alkylation response protein AidB-like acyl-CoA dehydrogenase